MSLELYFANLSSTTGAVDFVLLADDASVSGTPSKKIRKRRSVVNTGPPNCPLRQESNDKLDDKSTYKRAFREKTQGVDTLNNFYNEVAPGIRPTSKKCLSPTTSLNRNFVRSGIMAEVMKLTNFEAIEKRCNDEPEKTFSDYLDAVQDVVEGSKSNRSADKERRWSCSSITSAKALILKDLDDVQTLQRSSFDSLDVVQETDDAGRSSMERRWSGPHLIATTPSAA